VNGSPLARIVESLGWTLLHFVWQGALIAATLYCLLALMRNASASIRYVAACAALFGAPAAVVLTLVWQIDHISRIDSFSRFDGISQFDRADGRATQWDLAATHAVAEGTAGVGANTDQPQSTNLAVDDFGAWPDRLREWLPTMVGLWAAGVGLLSLRLFVGWRTIRRLRGDACLIDDPVWIERFAELRGRLGVSQSVRLLASAAATVPFVVGWLRPVVLVPAGLLTGLNAGELEAILAHELAHIRRHDFLVNLLQNVVETLLFYHPAIWWMSAQVRREREHCCDDAAVAACGGVLDYAKALMALEQLRPATGLMVAASGGSLLARIRRLAGGQDPGRSVWPAAALALVLGVLGALLAVERLSMDQENVRMTLPGGGVPVVPEFFLQVRIGRDPAGEVELYLNDQTTDEESLRRFVTDLVVGGNDPAVLLIGDEETRYRDVVKMMDMMTSLGVHKISLEKRRAAVDAGPDKKSEDRTSEEDAGPLWAEEPAAARAAGVAVEANREPVEKPELPDTFNGGEIIARVGPEVILASDVLPDANHHLKRVLDYNRAPQTPPQDEVERLRKLYMSKFLEHVIETKLVIVEGKRKLPKEAWEKIEKQFNEQFDKEYLAMMIESEACQSRAELDIKLHKDGSSLEALRCQAMERSFAQHWIDEKARDDREITDEDMHAYYQAHLAAYETPARARWEHLMVRFDNFDTKEQARQAIAGWRREIQEGTPFGDLATAHSQDISASDGGMHNWTSKDSLLSEVLDEAIFTLPVGQLSQILEDMRRFHIIRVVERNDQMVTPFTETQPEIRKQIHEARVREKRQQYRFNLRKTIPVWNIFDAAAGETEAKPAEKPADAAAGQSGEGPSRLDRGDTSNNAPKTGPGRPVYPELYRGDGPSDGME
jgi:beta-lactamase regulating signal transducer with metallopeptidase domain